jgi:radical SAM protein with 4Fe4S-binding SPASM domain
VLNVFFMVCTGRGEELTDITPQQYEEVLGYLGGLPGPVQRYAGARPLRAPFQAAGLRKRSQFSALTKATGYMGGGCLAGTNYARVTPNGELTPCPYMPLSAGNVRETSFVDLWERSDVFNSFRYPQLKGKCGDCEYTDICGGCRARPYVDHGDWLDEDQWCLYTPKGGEKIKVAFNTPEETDIAWDEASELRLSRIPYFSARYGQEGRGTACSREAGISDHHR